MPNSHAKRLTDDGARLAAGLRHPLDAIETACAEVTARASTATPTVHCALSLAARWPAPRLPRSMARHPAIPIRLSSGAGHYDFLRDEATDVAIVHGDRAVEPGVSLESLGEEEINAVCAPALNASLARFDRRALMGLRLIESSVSPVRWSDWFAANGLGRHPPTPTTGFDRGALVVSAAVQGVGVALESERFTEAELGLGQLVMLGGPRFRSIQWVLHRMLVRTGSQPHRVRVFRSWLLKEVGATRRDIPARDERIDPHGR